MTAAASNSPQPYEVPEGGLGSFLTATVGDWSDEALNADNYYDIVKPTAEQLAAFGREEDDRIAHVATGETVIPMAVFEEDPALKEVLFSRMRDMGIDPERYVVGNQLNSINPVTGQPEFFLKKIFKGIKKAVKGVIKVFKKIAPIVLSIAGSIMLGPIGAALGSGIGTLIQGGDLKDAFKSAAIAGITAGVTQGISDGIGAAGDAATVAKETGTALTFGEKLSAGLEGFGQSIGEGVGLVEGTSYLDQLGSASGIFNPTGEALSPISEANPANITNIDPNLAVASAAPGAQQAGASTVSVADQASQLAKGPTTAQLAQLKAPTLSAAPSVTDRLIQSKLNQNAILAGQPAPDVTAQTLQELADLGIGTAPSAPGGITTVTAVPGNVPLGTKRTFFQKFGDYMRRGGQSPDAVKQAMANAKADMIRDTLAELKTQGITGQAAQQFALKAGEEAAKAAGPGILARFGPSVLALTGLASAAGAFEVPGMEELEGGFGPSLPPYPFAQPGSLYKPIAAAMGGEINDFPRKNGPINGPGTGTSDDIPAMLSDGEFVMTAKAVRGAGNGSRQAGMNRMYDMMRRYEGAA